MSDVGLVCCVVTSLQAKIRAVKTRRFRGEWNSSSVALWSGGLRKVKLDASLRSLLDPSHIKPHGSSWQWKDNNYK